MCKIDTVKGIFAFFYPKLMKKSDFQTQTQIFIKFQTVSRPKTTKIKLQTVCWFADVV